jgi:hypothetical protein
LTLDTREPVHLKGGFSEGYSRPRTSLDDLQLPFWLLQSGPTARLGSTCFASTKQPLVASGTGHEPTVDEGGFGVTHLA